MTMDRDTYNRVREETFERVRTLTQTKGKDYSTDDDALVNFKRHAQALGLTPHQVWAVYAGKHWDAIQTFIRTLGQGHQPSEPIAGRVDDLITYLTLLMGLLVEGGHADQPKQGDLGKGHVAGTLGNARDELPPWARRYRWGGAGPIDADVRRLIEMASQAKADHDLEPEQTDAALRQVVERLDRDQFLALDRALIARHRADGVRAAPLVEDTDTPDEDTTPTERMRGGQYRE
jgi:hypothetical protein